MPQITPKTTAAFSRIYANSLATFCPSVSGTRLISTRRKPISSKIFLGMFSTKKAEAAVPPENTASAFSFRLFVLGLKLKITFFDGPNGRLDFREKLFRFGFHRRD